MSSNLHAFLLSTFTVRQSDAPTSFRLAGYEVNAAGVNVHFVNERRKALGPVAVRFAAGLNRTGTMLGVHLIAEGDNAEVAIRRIREVEGVAADTSRQIQFLEQFAQRIRQPSVLSSGTNEARRRE